MWHLIQFTDGIWHVCTPVNIKLRNGRTMAKWPSDGKYYEATIFSTGGKEEMNAMLLVKATDNINSKCIVPSSDLCKQGLNTNSENETPVQKRTWRRFCNVLPDIQPRQETIKNPVGLPYGRVQADTAETINKIVSMNVVKEVNRAADVNEPRDVDGIAQEFRGEQVNKVAEVHESEGVSGADVEGEVEDVDTQMANGAKEVNKKEEINYTEALNESEKVNDAEEIMEALNESKKVNDAEEMMEALNESEKVNDAEEMMEALNESEKVNDAEEMKEALNESEKVNDAEEIMEALNESKKVNDAEEMMEALNESEKVNDAEEMMEALNESEKVNDAEEMKEALNESEKVNDAEEMKEALNESEKVNDAEEMKEAHTINGVEALNFIDAAVSESVDINMLAEPSSSFDLKTLKYSENFEEDVFAEESSEYFPSNSDSSEDGIAKTSKKKRFKKLKKLDNDPGSIMSQSNFSTHVVSLPLSDLQTKKPIYVSSDNANHTCVKDVTDNTVIQMPELRVASVSNTVENRKWDKKYFCCFCKKSVAKLPRHLYSCHSEESEVVQIISQDKNSPARKNLIEALQNRGRYIEYKTNILEGQGTITTKRRIKPNLEKKVTDYLPCQFCFQLFAKSYVGRHMTQCKFSKVSSDMQNGKSRIKSSCFMLFPVGCQTTQRFKDCILSRMNVDDILQAIRSDKLIISFGEAELQRLGYETRYHRSIIDRIRELGRLRLAAEKIDSNIKSLTNLINPTLYKVCRQAVFSVAGYNSELNTFKSPSLALKIGFSLRKCVTLLKGEYLEDDILREEIPKLDAFLAVLNSKWAVEVTSHAYRTLSERKWNKPKRIPLIKDIQILHKYLKNKSAVLMNTLTLEITPNEYAELVEITLVMVILLNRRRVGEVQYMLLKDYSTSNQQELESDAYQSLTESERELTKSLKRILIKGKRGRGVPVLLTTELQCQVDLLIEHRRTCGIDSSNPFLFPSLKHSSGFYRGYELLSKFAKSAGCAHPDTITSTKLRKHVATTVQLLNLKDNELDCLAQFMGHDIRVHRQFYRLADETVQLAKLSKVFLNMDQGKIHNMMGKNLDEINVDDEVECTDSEDDLELCDTDMVSVTNTQSNSNVAQKEANSCHDIVVANESITKQKRQHVVKHSKKSKKPGKEAPDERTGVKKPLTMEQKDRIMTRFGNYIAIKKLPGKVEIDNFLLENRDIFANCDWRKVKYLVYNKFQKHK